jgi:hypothetical protein
MIHSQADREEDKASSLVLPSQQQLEAEVNNLLQNVIDSSAQQAVDVRSSAGNDGGNVAGNDGGNVAGNDGGSAGGNVVGNAGGNGNVVSKEGGNDRGDSGEKETGNNSRPQRLDWFKAQTLEEAIADLRYRQGHSHKKFGRLYPFKSGIFSKLRSESATIFLTF